MAATRAPFTTACSPDSRSQTSVCDSAPSDNKQRRIPNNRSGICLEKISAPAPAPARASDQDTPRHATHDIRRSDRSGVASAALVPEPGHDDGLCTSGSACRQPELDDLQARRGLIDEMASGSSHEDPPPLYLHSGSGRSLARRVAPGDPNERAYPFRTAAGRPVRCSSDLVADSQLERNRER